jgi:hypothetical protein
VRLIAPAHLLLLLACGLIVTGCSSGSVSGTVPVSGKVIYQGQPVTGATVSFVGEGNARPAVAISDESGTYDLMTLDTRGAMPGKYTVLVSKMDAVAGADKPISMDEAAKNMGKAKEPKSVLPAKYADPAKTPFKVEVKPRTNKLDLQLQD